VVRPALLTAMLGYTFVALGVFIDLGRYYNIWHMLVPKYWQGNSALFEVGVCVLMYLTVLYIEFLPIVVERFKGRVNLPGTMARLNGVTEGLLKVLDATLSRVMTIFIILGVVLSCAHQSSLGTLLVIAPGKLHPLWHTTILPLQFLLSAFAVGLAMVIFESYLASRSLKHPFDLDVLAPLGRMIPFLLTIYFTAKLIDMVTRGTYVYLTEPTVQTFSWLAEVVLGVVVPAFLLMTHRLRRKPKWLFTAAAMVVGGVALNRINVFVIGYQPLYAEKPYVPAWTEILVTAGFISIIVLLYRFFVFNFPVLDHHEGEAHHA
jgi:Ni/Fe-hydrogenase subunit HybB-like protein